MENKPNIIVKKHTGVELVQLAASFTSGHESKITLKRAYKTEHSIIRTQIFTVECYGIPLFVSTHFIRHHVGSQPYQLTCRIDRPGGGNPHLKERIAEVNALLADGKIEEACDILDWLADTAGIIIGTIILRNTWKLLAPSIFAASSISDGIPRKLDL